MKPRRVRGQQSDGAKEWVGGRVSAPFYVTEPSPYRPEMILWLELPEGFVLAMELIDPAGPSVSFGESLSRAMRAPMVGPPRRPARIRVEDARLAAELRMLVPPLELRVAPTPEIQEILRSMAELPGGEDPVEDSYFEDGRVGADAVAALFSAALVLHAVAPWKSISDDSVLRLDIPALGVEGACVSIIGALGESVGVVIFPSLQAFEGFLAAAEVREAGGAPADLHDLGTTMLSLSLVRAPELPAAMRREAAEHGWPVASTAAYPWVQHRDRDGMPRPLAERDVRIASACAAALAPFFARHGSKLQHMHADPVCESYFDENDLEVRLTAPYEAGIGYAVNDPEPAQPLVRATPKHGRNAPCPCGSGKKYKKCCLLREQTQPAAEPAPPQVHELDQRLVERMMRFALQRSDDVWERASRDFGDPRTEVALFVPWAAYHVASRGEPIAHWFLESESRRLSRVELRWLEAQKLAWLSAWEVRSVDPGHCIALEDLLTGEPRVVREQRASKTLGPRDVILARVVDFDGESWLSGTHSRPLPPVQAAEVIRRIRARLRRKQSVPVDRMRDEKIGRALIRDWEAAVVELGQRARVPVRLQNTDGDPLLFTVDHFELDRSQRAALERSIAALPGVDPPSAGDPDRSYVFTRSGSAVMPGEGTTIVGRAELSAAGLRVETNSVKRADALRAQLESACAGQIRHRVREHSDPLAHTDPAPGGQRAKAGRTGAAAPSGLPPGVEAAAIRAFKESHYASWADHPLPALGGKSPRQAARTQAGRERLNVILKDSENREARLPEPQRFDFSVLRRELGLPD